MSVSFYANAIIGVEVSLKKLQETEEEDIVDVWESAESFHGFHFCWNTDYERLFVGRFHVKTGDISYKGEEVSMVKIDSSLTDLERDLKVKLSELGLWTDQPFGLYVVGKCSY